MFSIPTSQTVLAKAVKITKGFNKVTTYADTDTTSGKAMHRHFCSLCSTSLYIDTATEVPIRKTIVHYVTINEREKLPRPTNDIFAKDRLEWVPEFEGAKSWNIYPDSS